MHEISLGPQERWDLSEPAKPAQVRWSPPSAQVPGSGKSRRARKKRPPKTHGQEEEAKEKEVRPTRCSSQGWIVNAGSSSLKLRVLDGSNRVVADRAAGAVDP